jgi:hypothetical protein
MTFLPTGPLVRWIDPDTGGWKVGRVLLSDGLTLTHGGLVLPEHFDADDYVLVQPAIGPGPSLMLWRELQEQPMRAEYEPQEPAR